ncbi:hypothetical protein D3C71_1610250 [compost metagenome]
MKSLKRSSNSYMPKFIDPMFNEATSGLNVVAGSMRSLTGSTGDPPVVMLMTTSLAALMRGRNCAYSAGSWVGLPV